MKKKILTGLTATLLFSSIVASPAGHKTRRPARRTAPAAVDTVKSQVEKSEATADAISRLTDDDYREVADRLGIEIATIKAVVEIEAGAAHEGFYKAGMPIINFDMSMFRKFAGKNGINLSKYYKSHAIVFSRPNASRYGGSTQAAQHARLKAARTIHYETAIQGCFWGMFQIGGFNWRRCGCGSIDEFVEKMSRSERSQLELFADFVTNSGMLPHLQKKNWSAFARMYNGTSYASRGYHTRLAASYARHKR